MATYSQTTEYVISPASPYASVTVTYDVTDNGGSPPIVTARVVTALKFILNKTDQPDNSITYEAEADALMRALVTIVSAAPPL